jgi:flagellar motor switch protein FliM
MTDAASMRPGAVNGASRDPAAEGEFAGRRIIVYDFKRPDKFSLEQIRTVSIIHETFSRLACTTLSASLRSLVHLSVASVDQLTLGEFIGSIPAPGMNAVIGLEPLRGQAIFEIDPAITFSIIDRLLGGQGEGRAFERGLTDLEASLMDGILARLLGNLREAWAQVIDMRPKILTIETNPMFIQIVPPMEMAVLVSMEAKIGDAAGMMNFCIPYLTIEPIIHKLSAHYWYSMVRRGGNRENLQTLLGHMENFDIDAEILVEAEKLSLKALGALKKGSLVRLPGQERGEAWFRMGGRRVFGMRAKPGKGGKPQAYEITEKPFADSIPAINEAEALRESDAESSVGKALEEFKQGIASVLSGISSGIASLREKQDELTDQLALGPPQEGAPEALGNPGKKLPFERVRAADPIHVLNFLQQEHPQLIALVLSYLDPRMASFLFGKLSAEIQSDVARRIALMERTAPEVIQDVERTMEKGLAVLSSSDYVAAGGVESVVEILNLVDRSTEKYVVETLEKEDPALAEGIKQRMFVFEDIILLDRKAAVAVIKRVDVETLARAMKAVPDTVKEFIFGCMAEADAEDLEKKCEALGKIRLSEVDAAQQRVVGAIREMEENGEIMIARPEETVE